MHGSEGKATLYNERMGMTEVIDCLVVAHIDQDTSQRMEAKG